MPTAETRDFRSQSISRCFAIPGNRRCDVFVFSLRCYLSWLLRTRESRPLRHSRFRTSISSTLDWTNEATYATLYCFPSLYFFIKAFTAPTDCESLQFWQVARRHSCEESWSDTLNNSLHWITSFSISKNAISLCTYYAMGSMDTSKRVSVQWWNYAPKGKNTALSKILISRRSADSVRSGDLVPLFCAIMMVQSN